MLVHISEIKINAGRREAKEGDIRELVCVMTGGGPVNSPYMLSSYSYKLSFEMFKYSKGSAAANVLLLILLVVGVFYIRVTTEEEDEQ